MNNLTKEKFIEKDFKYIEEMQKEAEIFEIKAEHKYYKKMFWPIEKIINTKTKIF